MRDGARLLRHLQGLSSFKSSLSLALAVACLLLNVFLIRFTCVEHSAIQNEIVNEDHDHREDSKNVPYELLIVFIPGLLVLTFGAK